MAVLDIAIVAVLVVLVIAIVRVANLLSANPYQQIQAHEDLAGPTPPDMTFLQKLDLRHARFAGMAALVCQAA